MGAVISLAVASIDKKVAYIRESLSAASMRSRRSSHSTGRDSTGRQSAGEISMREGDDAAVIEGDTSTVEVKVQVDTEKKRKTKRPDVPRSMQNQQTRNIYGSPWQVLLSPFVLGQLVFNAISSVACSVGVFYLLFAVLVVPPGEPLLVYHWTSPNCIGVVVGSALVVSPTLVMILAPAGIPEAVDKGWFFVVRASDCPPWMLRFLPFLRSHERWRRGMLRHFVLGLQLSLLFIPVPLVIAWKLVADADGNMTTWTLIWFDLVFETVLTVPCTLFGLLAFAMQGNYERVKETMSEDPHAGRRLAKRIVGCLRLLC